MRWRVPNIEIPTWMDQSVPGAAQAARMIARENLSNQQYQRLVRLTGDATKRAWLEPRRQRHTSKRKLTEDELYNAHHELMWEAYRAANFQPIGRPEIEQSKDRLLLLSTEAETLARGVRETGQDVLLAGLWATYRNNRRSNTLLRSLPDDLLQMAHVIDLLADFFQRAAPRYKFEGPVPPVGKPQDVEALKTTVIRQIAQTCRKHFGTVLSSTVARLANASLDRTDINRDTVKRSWRPPRGTGA
jgi:hypothetical protein